MRLDTAVGMRPSTPGQPVDWQVTDGLTGYSDAVATMDARVAAIKASQEYLKQQIAAWNASDN